jgi:hypothetical protein
MKINKQIRSTSLKNTLIILFMIIINFILIIRTKFFNSDYLSHLDSNIFFYVIYSLIVLIVYSCLYHVLIFRMININPITYISVCVFLLLTFNYFFSDKILFNLLLNFVIVVLAFKLIRRVLFEK